MHIGPTAHTPLALGRIEVGLLPSPLGLTTNVRTFMMLAVEPGDAVAIGATPPA